MANPKVLEPRLCACCGLEFIPTNNRQKFYSKAHAKKAANRRARGESLSDRVVRLEGRRCGGCGSEEPGRRFAFFWDREDQEAENVDAAIVACYRCNKIGNRLRLGQERLFESFDRLADDELVESLLPEESDGIREAIAAGDLSIRFSWEIGVTYAPPAPPDASHYDRPPAPPSPVNLELDPSLSVKDAIMDLIVRRITGEGIATCLKAAA